ncbi:hypothetical protein VNO80_12340 [Phaseolus coccineus]|uniref:Uncharacterized protein n=1 Tax=Phaseolus coccineus TaxID=3886 RepID=A0AAN9N4V0_PHACN
MVSKRQRQFGGYVISRSWERLSRLSQVESDNDIIQCNNRLKLEEYLAESARIWELGKHLGMKCSGDEEDVIRVLDDWKHAF